MASEPGTASVRAKAATAILAIAPAMARGRPDIYTSNRWLARPLRQKNKKIGHSQAEIQNPL
jgi:hypothetical protein